MKIRLVRHSQVGRLLAVACLFALPVAVQAQSLVVPGTGIKLTEVGDDFEDEAWEYVYNLPKSSNNIDGQTRGALGASVNGRLVESGLRGQPDLLQRVPTPPGGIPGSQGSLLMRSLMTGVPERPSFQMQQDDLIVPVSSRLGTQVPVSWSPNFTVRVFLPEFDQWEPRTGNSFALRAGVRTHTPKKTGKGIFARTSNQEEPYWPGMFIHFNSKADGRNKEDSAHFLIRATTNGGDIRGPEIKQLGWWTLGMSFTPDGRVHYYARPGVEELTAADHITSQYPYGYTTERFNAFFFNVVNGDNGRTWSTPWIIDDPTMYVLHYPRGQQEQRTAARP